MKVGQKLVAGLLLLAAALPLLCGRRIRTPQSMEAAAMPSIYARSPSISSSPAESKRY